MYLPREEERKLFGMLRGKEALALIGPRRSGKTSLAVHLLENWENNGGNGKYFDLESLNAPSTAQKLVAEIEKTPRGSLIVLDEVQVFENWVKVVRGEIENKRRHVLVSGSSASLLSKEIASALGGRAIPEAILPLSYRDARIWGIRSIKDYLKIGGYPECVLRPSDSFKLHKLYLELTILRDVAARKGIREIKPLSDLAVLLLSEPGKVLSARKTALALGISQPTFRSFVQALNDAFLILSVPPYLRSPRERIIADSRHYAYDSGLQSSISLSTEEDHGRRIENLVAIELVRKGYSLSYLKGQDWECDFIAQKLGSGTLAVQVWSGEGNIPSREIIGLEKGMKQTRAKGLFLSNVSADINVPANVTINGIEEWMLEEKRE